MMIVYDNDSIQKKFSPFVNKILPSNYRQLESCNLIVYITQGSTVRFTKQDNIPLMKQKMKSENVDYQKSDIVVIFLKPGIDNPISEIITTDGKKINRLVFCYQEKIQNSITIGNNDNFTTSCEELRQIISAACPHNPSTGTLHIEYPKQPVGVMEIPILGVAAVVLAVASSVFAT